MDQKKQQRSYYVKGDQKYIDRYFCPFITQEYATGEERREDRREKCHKEEKEDEEQSWRV